jgi:hypothetical protein
MRKLLFAAVVGGVLIWFLDPDSGNRRRQAMRHRLGELGVTRPVPPAAESSSIEAVPASIAVAT